MISYLGQIRHLLGLERRKLPLMVLLFLVSSMLDIAGLGLIGPFVTVVVDPATLDISFSQLMSALGLWSEPQAQLLAFGIALVVIFVSKTILGIFIQSIIIRFSQGQQLRLRVDLMRHYQALPYTEYLHRNSSEYIYNIQFLSKQYSGVVLTLLRLTSDSIVGVAIIVFLAWTSGPALALLLALLGGFVFGFDRLTRNPLRRYGQKVNLANTEMVQTVHEGVEGLKEIRILGCEDYFLGKVSDRAQQVKRYQVPNSLIKVVPQYLLELIMVTFIVLLVLGSMFLNQNLSGLLPTLAVFGVATLRLMPSANMLSGSLADLRYCRDGVGRLYRDLEGSQTLPTKFSLNRERQIPNSITKNLTAEPFRSLEIHDLNFRYPGALQNSLESISLRIRAGESIGLIGTSGAGKTTLIDIVLGLLEPQQGGITFNGRPLQEAIGEWRSQTAYLPQQVFLIDDTLKRNIALGVEDEQIDDHRLQESLRQARLTSFLGQLSDGVETFLGERGIRLSGGQRQRVALARAFYHGRRVLIMDEATSALDQETENAIIEEIEYLKGKVTLIVIAHRFTTVQHCHQIYRLEGGHIVEHGTPDQMLH